LRAIVIKKKQLVNKMLYKFNNFNSKRQYISNNYIYLNSKAETLNGALTLIN
jgi:hypothetical protein